MNRNARGLASQSVLFLIAAVLIAGGMMLVGAPARAENSTAHKLLCVYEVYDNVADKWMYRAIGQITVEPNQDQNSYRPMNVIIDGAMYDVRSEEQIQNLNLSVRGYLTDESSNVIGVTIGVDETDSGFYSNVAVLFAGMQGSAEFKTDKRTTTFGCLK